MDGKAGDWDNFPSLLFEKQDVSVAFANDSNYLYLLFRCRDSKWAEAISREGITLWFDTTSSKKKSLGINYRSPQLAPLETADVIERKSSSSVGLSTSPNIPIPGSQIARITVLGDPKDKGLLLVAGESSGIAAEATTEFAGYTYEFSIPIGGQNAALALEINPGCKLAMGVEFGMKHDEQTPGMKHRFGDGSPPHGDLSPDGVAIPPGARIGDGRDRKEMPAENRKETSSAGPQEIWFSTTLALPPVQAADNRE